MTSAAGQPPERAAAGDHGAGAPAVPPPAAPESSGGTGHAAVEAALADLDALEQRPVSEHAAVYDRVHDQLRAVLADQTGAEQAPDRSPPSGVEG